MIANGDIQTRATFIITPTKWNGQNEYTDGIYKDFTVLGANSNSSRKNDSNVLVGKLLINDSILPLSQYK